MQFLDDSLLPENQQPLVIQVANTAPIPAQRFQRHPGDDGRAGAEGGGLLECRRDRAPRALPRSRRPRLQRLSMFNGCWRGCATRCRHAAAGRRLDRSRRRRGRRREVAERRHAHMLAELDPRRTR